MDFQKIMEGNMKVSKILLASAMLAGMMLASCGGGDTPVEPGESTAKSASAPKSSAPKDSVTTTYTYSDANAKKTYTLLEGASLEGIVVKEIKTHTINTSANSETDATSKCKAAFNSDGTKVIITLPDKTTKEIAITLDTAAAKNTIYGDDGLTIVLSSRTSATVTKGDKSAVFAITQSLTGKVLGFTKGAKTSGDDEALEAVPGKVNVTYNATAQRYEIAKATMWVSDEQWNNSQDAGTYVTVWLNAEENRAVVLFQWSYESEAVNKKDMMLIDCSVEDGTEAGTKSFTMIDIAHVEGATPRDDQYSTYAPADRIGGALNDPVDQCHWLKSNGGATHTIKEPTTEMPGNEWGSELLAFL